eukprot:TRINITY_DN2788_c0_g1_i2.p1 TRINITY_DN2788_c0_g1~~TRINITY_DN2788_c0_g1_i2.p1  ORF type:complete len:231 (+),score=65.63 TRINITY_DN2788_c0_g1_i2:35-694(+)
MPASRRQRKTQINAIGKKTKDQKNDLIENIRTLAETYENIYVLNVHNMRNVIMKEIRLELRNSSRFLFGKNKLFHVALGKSVEEEFDDNLHLLTAEIKGDCGVMFTNLEHEKVVEYFNNKIVPEYARTGFVAVQRIVIPEGPLEGFSHNMVEQFRRLGMTVRIEKGVIYNEREIVLSEPGEPLTAQQSDLLKKFNVQSALFEIQLLCKWSKGNFTKLEN